MEKQDASKRAFEDLVKVAKHLVFQIEKDCFAKLGRDKVERDSHLNRITGITYGTLLQEVKAAFKQNQQDIIRNVERW